MLAFELLGLFYDFARIILPPVRLILAPPINVFRDTAPIFGPGLGLFLGVAISSPLDLRIMFPRFLQLAF